MTASATAGTFKVAAGAVIDVGKYELTSNSDLALNDGAILAVANVGGAYGSLILGSGADLTSTGKFILSLSTDDVVSAWDGQAVIIADSGVLSTDIVNSLFHKVIVVGDLSYSALVVDGDPTFTNSLEVLDGNGTIQVTPNMTNVFGLMNQYLGDIDNNSELIEALEETITAIAVLNPAEADIAVRQLIGESMVNTLAAVESTAQKTHSVVLGRIDRIREVQMNSLVPPAAGAGDELNRIWAGGFGVWAEAKNRNNVYGYDYKAHWAAIGYDRDVAAFPGLRLGFSAIFAKGEMDNNDDHTDADLDTVGFASTAATPSPTACSSTPTSPTPPPRPNTPQRWCSRAPRAAPSTLTPGSSAFGPVTSSRRAPFSSSLVSASKKCCQNCQRILVPTRAIRT